MNSLAESVLADRRLSIRWRGSWIRFSLKDPDLGAVTLTPLQLPWDLRLTLEQFKLVCRANREVVL